MAEYHPYRDHWRRYEIPVRPGDHDSRAEGTLTCLVRADELTPAEVADLSPAEQAEVAADLAAMDLDPMLCGRDEPGAWRDGEAAVRRTDPPIAAE